MIFPLLLQKYFKNSIINYINSITLIWLSVLAKALSEVLFLLRFQWGTLFLTFFIFIVFFLCFLVFQLTITKKQKQKNA